MATSVSKPPMEMSKTYQYRKVMKPMLERKRRARINKCLDELKDLMVATLESEGEHVTRLEKADILELTVTHLQKIKEQRKTHNGILSQAECFRTGYIYAANEVSRTLAQLPGVNVSLGTQLMTHLGQRLNQIQPPPIKIPTPINPTIISPSTAFHNHNSVGNNHSHLIGYSSTPSSSSSSSGIQSSFSLSGASTMSTTSSQCASIFDGPLSPAMSTRSSCTSESPRLIENNNNNHHHYFHKHQTDDNVWRPW